MESAQDYFGPPCIQKVATFAEVTCTFYEASRAKAHGPATIFSSQAIKHQRAGQRTSESVQKRDDQSMRTRHR